LGYKFVVEPQGPELPDDGPTSATRSRPAIADGFEFGRPHLRAGSKFARKPTLIWNSKYGLSTVHSTARGCRSSIRPVKMTGWFRMKQGGVYTGAFLLDAHYGILEEASWDDLGETGLSLNDLLGQYQGSKAVFTRMITHRRPGS